MDFAQNLNYNLYHGFERQFGLTIMHSIRSSQTLYNTCSIKHQNGLAYGHHLCLQSCATVLRPLCSHSLTVLYAKRLTESLNVKDLQASAKTKLLCITSSFAFYGLPQEFEHHGYDPRAHCAPLPCNSVELISFWSDSRLGTRSKSRRQRTHSVAVGFVDTKRYCSLSASRSCSV